LNSQTKIFQAGSFNFKLNHIVIIGVLVLAFSISFLIRSQPAEYGFELNEFDPFFNFRATEYIVDNGFNSYFNWIDNLSWYGSGTGDPLNGGIASGRNVSSTSQIGLHITAASTYWIFGGGTDLYDYTILFPVIIGSLTVIALFGLVRLFGGTTAGLFASMFFAVSVPIISRGTIGWFKSEPLGLFYGLLGLYLFFSAIKSKNKKIAICKIILGGITMGLGMASWGGNQFFIIPLGLFILVLPFVRKDHKFLLWSIPLFVTIFLLISGIFERPGIDFVFGIGGFSLIFPTIFLVSCIFIQKISKEENKIRNGLILLISIMIIGSTLLVVTSELNITSLPSFRYLNAINPFLIAEDPLTDSVAEHATTTIAESFYFHSILMIFAALGVWLILNKKISKSEIHLTKDVKAFVLIFGITGVYISSAFVRLELFSSLSVIILASIGLSILSKQIFKTQFFSRKNYLFKVGYVIIIVSLFMIPLTYPADANWISIIDFPATIMTGGTGYPPSSDWLEALEWMKTNTPEDSIIVSWWDYGYWIQTLGERATLIDNSTLNDWRIKQIANIFLSEPTDGWNTLNEINVDYVVVFVAGQKLDVKYNDQFLYLLGGGGDDAKAPWFVHISEQPVEKYLHSDQMHLTNYFWNETLLGKMIPYTTLLYYNEQTKEQSDNYIAGFTPVHIKNIEYGFNDNTPLQLVYASPSFTNDETKTIQAVLIYKVNKEYVILDD
jgi:dolichyl-diphosphooligosaccharide--protein glycosyltransferase